MSIELRNTSKDSVPQSYEDWVQQREGYLPFIDCEEEPQIDKSLLYEKEIKSCIEIDDKGKPHFIDGRFADLYRKYNNVIYSNGVFYTPNGMLRPGVIRQEIHNSILGLFPTNIAQNTTKVLNALQDNAYEEDFDWTNKMVIPFANGDMTVKKKGNWNFKLNSLQPVPYRLPVNFIPLSSPRKTPNFTKWLNDLFYPQDIITLQEYLGYCFLPTTRAQKALLLIGEGGVGKSVISNVLQALFGSSVTAPDSTVEFLKERFKLAELENQLVFYEDDLDDTTLQDAGKFKKLVTNQSAITAERKGRDPFKFIPYCRFVICGNHMLETDNDKSDGFYRRLLPLMIKPKDPNRKDIMGFEIMVESEAEGIVQWALEGLKRLIENDWIFSVSNRTESYMQQYRELTDHMPLFIQDCFTFSNDGTVTNEELKNVYLNWCSQNGVRRMSFKEIKSWMLNNAEKYHLIVTGNASIIRNGKRYRGYKGASVSEQWQGSGSLFVIK